MVQNGVRFGPKRGAIWAKTTCQRSAFNHVLPCVSEFISFLMYTIYDYAYNGLLYLNDIMRSRHKRLSQLMI